MTERAETPGREPVKPTDPEGLGGSGGSGGAGRSGRSGGSGTLPPPPARRSADTETIAVTDEKPTEKPADKPGAAADTKTTEKPADKAAGKTEAKPAGAAAAAKPAEPAPAAEKAEKAGRFGRGRRADEEHPTRMGDEFGPRRVRLAVSRVDPWSVAMVSFLLSVALGIMFIVATVIIWFLLDSMHVFASIEELFVSVGSESFGQLLDYVRFDRVLTMAALVAIVDVVLLTALATLSAFLYNIAASLVGGVHLTLTDD